MKRALQIVAVPLLVLACGGEPPMPKSADEVAAADAPAADAPAADAPAGDAPAADAAKSGGDEAWAGESEAKAEAAASGGDKPAETRTMEVIAKLVKDNRQPVRDCMDKVKKQLPDLKGDMVIHFIIDPEGKVTKAELNVEKSSLKNPDVAKCAIDTITGIKFPPSSRQMQSEVNYPYNLN